MVGTRIRLRGPSLRSVVLMKAQQQGEARAHELVGTRTAGTEKAKAKKRKSTTRTMVEEKKLALTAIRT